MVITNKRILTDEHIETFQRDGILIVDDILTADELKAAQRGLHRTLMHYGVDSDNLRDTAHHLQKLSSTNGSGGVLDIFYPNFKMEISCNERLFRATTELWETAYCHGGESDEEMMKKEEGKNHYKFHPFGPFDYNKGYMYIDRIGYRLPTKLAQEVGEAEESKSQMEKDLLPGTNSNHHSRNPAKITKKSQRRKAVAIQRSLTPHLDCCPDTYYSTTGKPKWRPIQCFISLTNNLEPNTGGFEAVPGFHRLFNQWTKERKNVPSRITKRDKKTGAKSQTEISAPCIGEYTHIRPKEDEGVMKRVRHIPVRAGSVVFWDNRIPHANAYTNDSEVPRAVVYCSFLPDVPINRKYAERQLEDYRALRFPRDQWIGDVHTEDDYEAKYKLSELGRKLLAIEAW